MKRRFKHGSKLATEIAEASRRFFEKRNLYVPKKWGKPKPKGKP